MDIRNVSDEEKAEYLANVSKYFAHMRQVLYDLETDNQSSDLATQAAGIWVSGNLCRWFDDFMKQIQDISKNWNDAKNEKMEVS